MSSPDTDDRDNVKRTKLMESTPLSVSRNSPVRSAIPAAVAETSKDVVLECLSLNDGASSNSATAVAPPALEIIGTIRSASLGDKFIQEQIANPTPQETAPPTTTLSGTNGDRLVLVMVGLPARGKTYIARRLCQFLSFFHGATCKVFNVGTYRREFVGAKTPAEFFRSDNEKGSVLRKQLAQMCMNDLKDWLRDPDVQGRVGIYDATNTERERREWILGELATLIPSKSQIVFVESVVNDDSIVEHNIREVKLKMPDYAGLDEESAVKDFTQRIEAYKDRYQPMGSHPSEKSISWVRVEDGGRMVIMNRIHGYLQGRICQLLSTLHTQKRAIYFSRHGQSEYNKLNKIGGDSPLTEEGEKYAVDLAKFVHVNILGLNEDGSVKSPPVYSHARLYTSSLRRTMDTARHIAHPVDPATGWKVMRPKAWRNLDEIYAGIFDAFTYESIATLAPEEFQRRNENKLTYRYPRGESYLDVIERLEPVVMELERQRDDILIVGHQGILRILYGALRVVLKTLIA